MAKAFNPYREWLGIPDHQQPPTHYRLLSIENFESDPGVITNAADRAMMFVRTFQTGQHSAESQQLLNEISAARVCLLNETKKREYDATLCGETLPPETPERVTSTAFVPVQHSVELELPDESPIQIEGADKYGVVPNWERPKPKLPPSRIPPVPKKKPEEIEPTEPETPKPQREPIFTRKPKIRPVPTKKPEAKKKVKPEKQKLRREPIFTRKNFVKLLVRIEKRLPSMKVLSRCMFFLVFLLFLSVGVGVYQEYYKAQRLRLGISEDGTTAKPVLDITDSELALLSEVIQLQTLDLEYDDEGCPHQITDAGLVHLKGLTRLQTLNLSGTQITDAGLEYLKGLTRLQTLNLNGTQITDAGLEYLKGLTQLRELHLSCCKQITDAGLEHLKGLSLLQTLNLEGYDQITAKGILELKDVLPKCNIIVPMTMRRLGISEDRTTAKPEHYIKDDELALLKGLTQLQTLDLRHCELITDIGLAYLKGLVQLQTLNLEGCIKVSDAGLVHLKGLVQLQTLNLEGCIEVSDAGLAHLHGLTQLRDLYLGVGYQITGTGVAELEKALPKCKIDW